MNKQNKQTLGKTLTALSLIGFTACVAWANETQDQCNPFTKKSGGSGSGCPGIYTGYAKMTNNIGTFWLTPPTNAISGTFTNTSIFASPFVSVTMVGRKSDFATWCGTNSVTFPATNTDQYSFTVYTKSPLPPPTNSEPMNLEIIWQTE